MRQPIQAVSAGRKEMTPERVAGIGFVAVLHVIVLWAIVAGLVQKIAQAPPPGPITATFDPVKHVPPPPAPQMPVVTLPDTPVVQTVPKPIIDIQPETPTGILGRPPSMPEAPAGPTVADQAVAGIAATHTIPPYPPLERRLGAQGTVTLRLTVSPQGVVTGADVIKSSGYPGLDQVAISWVMAHWKYKPAVQNGSPVASQTSAAVMFSLRNAG